MKCTNPADFGLTTNDRQRKTACAYHLKDAITTLGGAYAQPIQGPFGCDMPRKLPFGFTGGNA